jgi:hypothetical protein
MDTFPASTWKISNTATPPNPVQDSSTAYANAHDQSQCLAGATQHQWSTAGGDCQVRRGNAEPIKRAI